MVDIKVVLEKIEDNKEKLKEFRLSKNKIDKILNKLKTSDSLCTFLNSSIYNFSYTTKSFLEKLFIIYNIEGFKDILQRYEQYKQELLKFQNSYIFVNTEFKRKNEPIFVLAFMESKRHIKIDPKELIFKNDDEVLNHISNIIKKHYKQNNGKLEIWGNIKNYIFKYNDKNFVFDIKGDIIEDKIDIAKNFAFLRLK